MDGATGRAVDRTPPSRSRAHPSRAFVDVFIDAMKLHDPFGSWLCEHEFETVRARWRLWTNEGRSDDWIEQYVAAFRDVPVLFLCRSHTKSYGETRPG